MGQSWMTRLGTARPLNIMMKRRERVWAAQTIPSWQGVRMKTSLPRISRE